MTAVTCSVARCDRTIGSWRHRRTIDDRGRGIPAGGARCARCRRGSVRRGRSPGEAGAAGVGLERGTYRVVSLGGGGHGGGPRATPRRVRRPPVLGPHGPAPAPGASGGPASPARPPGHPGPCGGASSSPQAPGVARARTGRASARVPRPGLRAPGDGALGLALHVLVRGGPVRRRAARPRAPRVSGGRPAVLVARDRARSRGRPSVPPRPDPVPVPVDAGAIAPRLRDRVGGPRPLPPLRG